MISNMNSAMCEKPALAGSVAQLGQIYDPTVRDNIDAKIARLKEELASLEQSKETLSPLLDVKISQLRNAMSY